MIDALGKNGVRSKGYVGKYHNSVFDLKVSDIQRDDDNGIESIINLERPGIYEGDSIDVFLTLMSPVNDALQTFGPDRELILAIGEYEQVVNLDEELFNVNILDTEFLSNLEYEDYLTISLYQNSDSANILYEFAFVINGLHVYYQLTNDLNEIGLEKLDGTAQQVRTLGGLRLRYAYRAPINTEVLDVTWRFNHDGYYCTSPGVEHDNPFVCSFIAAGETFLRNVDGTDLTEECNIFECGIWWEPVDGAQNTLWSTDLAINGNSYVANTRPISVSGATPDSTQERTSEFDVRTRVLEPVVADPMVGADVEMLEGVLWQLGLSSQYGFAGSSGDRIDNIAPSGTVILSKDRNIYSTGFASFDVGASLSRSQTAVGSLEKMVRRFQGRNEAISDIGSARYSGNDSDGVVDNEVLGWLKNNYESYYLAYDENNNQGEILASYLEPNYEAWLQSAVALLNDGDATDSLVNPTYTSAIHNRITTDYTQQDLLNTWVRQENDRGHWGRGSPVTNFRVTEGSGDEFASVGFSQLKYFYFLGQNNRCTAIRSRNMFKPDDNLVAMMAWLAREERCDGAFYQAFDLDELGNRSGLLDVYDNAVEVAAGNPRLVSVNRDGSQTLVPRTGSYANDDYDLLSLVMMAYNQGYPRTNQNSWLGHMINPVIVNGINISLAGGRYAIDIKSDVRNRDGGGVGIPLKTFTFEWENVSTTPSVLYCFNYSEESFRSGMTWQQARDDVSRRVDCP